MTVPTFETIEITLFDNGVAELAFNRPQRYNALSFQAYKDLLAALRWAANCDDAKVTVLTGRGKFYTSGQELTLSGFADAEDPLTELRTRAEVTKNVVSEFIQFPKLIIAAVNGPSIGFGTTTLALCDAVYAVPHATFMTPFMRLGFCAEGCSSVLFPRIMGTSKANEMLLMGKTFSAEEMEKCGFVARTIPAEGFREAVLAIAGDAAKFSLEAMKVTKALIRDPEREMLEAINTKEIEALIERMVSPDSLQATMRFMEEQQNKKKKSKL